MAFKSFHHYMIMVRDLKQAMKFYGEGLGMPLVEVSWRMPADSNVAYFGSGGGLLEIFEARDPAKMPDPEELIRRTGQSHFCFWVDSIDKTIEQLAEAGYPSVLRGRRDSITPVAPAGTFARIAFFKDPDGNPFEIYEPAEAP